MVDGLTPQVFSIVGVSGTAIIDHGNTLVVRYETAAGAEVTLLIPRSLTSVLIDKLSSTLPHELTSAATK